MKKKFLYLISRAKVNRYLEKVSQLINNEKGGHEVPAVVYVIGSCALVAVALLVINTLLPGTIQTLWGAMQDKLAEWISGIGSI